jgi:hypothetical protein
MINEGFTYDTQLSFAQGKLPSVCTPISTFIITPLQATCYACIKAQLYEACLLFMARGLCYDFLLNFINFSLKLVFWNSPVKIDLTQVIIKTESELELASALLIDSFLSFLAVQPTLAVA